MERGGNAEAGFLGAHALAACSWRAEPSERTHTGAVCKELQQWAGPASGEIHGKLSPMGGT